MANSGACWGPVPDTSNTGALRWCIRRMSLTPHDRFPLAVDLHVPGFHFDIEDPWYRWHVSAKGLGMLDGVRHHRAKPDPQRRRDCRSPLYQTLIDGSGHERNRACTRWRPATCSRWTRRPSPARSRSTTTLLDDGNRTGGSVRLAVAPRGEAITAMLESTTTHTCSGA